MQHLLTHTYAARHIGIDLSMMTYMVTGVAAHVLNVLLHQIGPLSESSAPVNDRCSFLLPHAKSAKSDTGRLARLCHLAAEAGFFVYRNAVE